MKEICFWMLIFKENIESIIQHFVRDLLED